MNLKRVNINTLEVETIAEMVSDTFDVSDGFIYYWGFDLKGKEFIKKVNLEHLSDEEIIYEGTASFISAQKDGVYFLNFSILSLNRDGDGKIYKILPDGTIEAIGEHRVYRYNIHRDNIYYSNAEDNRFLYKMGMDGEKPELLIEKEILTISIYGDELYFTTIDEETGVKSWTYNLNTNEINEREF